MGRTRSIMGKGAVVLVAMAALAVPAGAVAGASTTASTASTVASGSGAKAQARADKGINCTNAQRRLDHVTREHAKWTKHLTGSQTRLSRLEAKTPKSTKNAGHIKKEEAQVQKNIARLEKDLNHTLSGKQLAKAKRYEAAAAQACHASPSSAS